MEQNWWNEYILNGYLLDWLTQYSVGTPTKAFSHWGGQECGNPSGPCGPGGWHLGSHTLAPKGWKIPKELLVFSLQWNPGEAGSRQWKDTAEAATGERNSQWAWRQAGEEQSPSPMSFYLGSHQQLLPTSRVGLPTSNNPSKKFPHGSVCPVAAHGWFQIHHTWHSAYRVQAWMKCFKGAIRWSIEEHTEESTDAISGPSADHTVSWGPGTCWMYTDIITGVCCIHFQNNHMGWVSHSYCISLKIATGNSETSTNLPNLRQLDSSSAPGWLQKSKFLPVGKIVYQ